MIVVMIKWFFGKKNNNNDKDFFQKKSKLNIFLEKYDEEDGDNFNWSNNNENNILNYFPHLNLEMKI